MTLRAMTMALALATVGCTAAHPSDEVRTGIYELIAEPEADGCTPMRTAGPLGPVGVLVREGAVDAPVPSVGGALVTAPRVQLAPSASYHAETNRRVPGCDSAFVREEWTLMESTGEGFELLHRQRWEGLEGCAAASAMPEAPELDCTSERRLRYALSTLCDAPCALRLDLSGALVCAC